MSTVSSRG